MTSPSSTYTAYIRESNTLKLIEHFCHLGSINWKAITASHAPNDHINCQHYAWHPTGWSSAWGALRKHQTRERSHAKLTCRWSALKSKNKLPSPCVTVANHQWMDVPCRQGFVSPGMKRHTLFTVCCTITRKQNRKYGTSPAVHL